MKNPILLVILSIILINCSKENSVEKEIIITDEEKIEAIIKEQKPYNYTSIDEEPTNGSCTGVISLFFNPDRNEVLHVVPNFDCGINSLKTYNYTVEGETIIIIDDATDFLFGVVTKITSTSLVFTSNIDKKIYLFERGGENTTNTP